MNDELLTIREVATYLRVDGTTVRRWIKNGVLEAVTLPHRGSRQSYRVRRATLDALLASPTRPAATDATSSTNGQSPEALS